LYTPDSNSECNLKVVRALSDAINFHVEKLHQKQQTILNVSVAIRTKREGVHLQDEAVYVPILVLKPPSL
jgi:hypothetical protein